MFLGKRMLRVVCGSRGPVAGAVFLELEPFGSSCRSSAPEVVHAESDIPKADFHAGTASCRLIHGCHFTKVCVGRATQRYYTHRLCYIVL